MKRLLLLLLFAAPLAAQTPVITCGRTPATVDQVCVSIANALGYDPEFAGPITDFLQGGAVASKIQAALLTAIRNQEVADVKALQAQIDALNAKIAAIPTGPPGAQGIQGVPGTPGAQGVPGQGIQGSQGVPGTPATIQIGNVVSVPCSIPASVTNTGTSTAAIFNFSIPKCGGSTTTAYALAVSTSAVRAGAVNLSGLTVKGTVYIFTSALSALNDPNPSGIAGVCYWLDPPRDTAGVVNINGAPVTCEGGVPWDFMGSASATTANPWNSATVANGQHTIIQRVIPIVGVPEIDSVSFTVAN